MLEERNVPQIRFKGFTDPWEQRKLSDVYGYEQPQPFIVSSTEYDSQGEIPVLTAGKSFILGYTREKSGVRDASVFNPVVIFDDFTTSAHFVDFPFKVKSSAMKILSLKNQGDNPYLAVHALQAVRYKPETHERHWISIFSELRVRLPRASVEQDAIGVILRNLDRLIALHQRKLDKLKSVKKSLLEKMFPKPGSDVPEIRFVGFTDPWEQRQLGDTVEVCSGRDYKHLPAGRIPVYGSGGYMTSVSAALSYARDAVGIGRKGTIDRPYRLVAPFWTVDTLFFSIPREGNDLDYLLGVFLRIDWKSKNEATGLPSLSKQTINEIEVFIPEATEQSRIGHVFAKLDNLITLHQRKLDILGRIKKSLLEKMFV